MNERIWIVGSIWNKALDYCKPKRGISFGQDPFDVKLAGDIQSGYRGRPKASVDNDFHLQRNISTSDTQAHT